MPSKQNQITEEENTMNRNDKQFIAQKIRAQYMEKQVSEPYIKITIRVEFFSYYFYLNENFQDIPYAQVRFVPKASPFERRLPVPQASILY